MFFVVYMLLVIGGELLEIDMVLMFGVLFDWVRCFCDVGM